MSAALIAEIFILVIYSLGILLSGLVLITLCIYCRPITKNISLILTCNTYLSLKLFCVSGLIFHANTIYGVVNPSALVDHLWCHTAFYFPFFSLCTLYFSYVIQALFRFFRIVLYKHKAFQSLKISCVAIFIQWVLAFIITLSFSLFKFTKYLPNERNCQISFENVFGFFAMLVWIYMLPIGIILGIYLYIVRFVRRVVQTQNHRKTANERDVTVLRRILLLSLALVVLGLPTLLIALIYWITQFLVPMAYIIRDLTVVIGIIFEMIVLAYITPQIREVFNRNGPRVHPLSNTVAHQNVKRPDRTTITAHP